MELFTNLGIDPTQRKIVVVKSTNHFMAAYGPIAKKVIYVESSGPLRRDHRKHIVFRHRSCLNQDIQCRLALLLDRAHHRIDLLGRHIALFLQELQDIIIV